MLCLALSEVAHVCISARALQESCWELADGNPASEQRPVLTKEAAKVKPGGC
jgi:hypothetical protein